MKGTVFLIAGFDLNHSAAHGEYRELRRAIKSKGYELVAVDIKWKHHTISKFAKEFTTLYNQKAGSHNIIIGNSFGAMVALVTAPELKPEKIILCSLSPFFKEDVLRFQPGKLNKWFGPRRVADFGVLSAKASAKQVNKTNIKCVLLYGEQEKKFYKKLVKRVIDTAKDLKHSTLIEIPRSPHSFKDPAYAEAIIQML